MPGKCLLYHKTDRWAQCIEIFCNQMYLLQKHQQTRCTPSYHSRTKFSSILLQANKSRLRIDGNHNFRSKTNITNDYKSINLKHQKVIFQILEPRFLAQGWLNPSRVGSFGRRLVGVLIENLLSESGSYCDAQHSLAGGCSSLISTFVFSLHFSSSILYTVSLVELSSTLQA